jgi:hypothetical protein
MRRRARRGWAFNLLWLSTLVYQPVQAAPRWLSAAEAYYHMDHGNPVRPPTLEEFRREMTSLGYVLNPKVAEIGLIYEYIAEDGVSIASATFGEERVEVRVTYRPAKANVVPQAVITSLAGLANEVSFTGPDKLEYRIGDSLSKRSPTGYADSESITVTLAEGAWKETSRVTRWWVK